MTSPYGRFVIVVNHLGLFYTCMTLGMIFAAIVSFPYDTLASLIFALLSILTSFLAFRFFRIEKNAR